MPIGIEQIEYFLPGKVITSKDLADRFGFSLEFVEGKLGIQRIYLAQDEELTSDLAVKAVEKIFQKRPEVKEKVGVIVVCTQTPDFQLPHTAALVQAKLGLKEDVASFDLNLGCSGFVYGLSAIRGFMAENRLDYGVLITAETYSKIIDEGDRNTKPLFSDAAAATLLGPHPDLVPGRFTFGTDGNKYDSLVLTACANRDSNDQSYLYMNGRKIFELVASQVPRDIQKCLSRNRVDINEIDWFVFHQASLFMLDTLSRKIGLGNQAKVLKNIDQFGNTVSSSIPIALKTIYDRLTNGVAKVLVSGFGVGLSWSSTILFSDGGSTHVRQNTHTTESFAASD